MILKRLLRTKLEWPKDRWCLNLQCFRANLTWTHRCLSGRQPPSLSSRSQRSQTTPTTKWSQTLRKPLTNPDRSVCIHSGNRHTSLYHHLTPPTYPELSKVDFVFVDQQHIVRFLIKLLKLRENVFLCSCFGRRSSAVWMPMTSPRSWWKRWSCQKAFRVFNTFLSHIINKDGMNCLDCLFFLLIISLLIVSFRCRSGLHR